MDVPHLHDWPTTEAEAVALQTALAGRVDTPAPLASFELVAGCDIAYHLTELGPVRRGGRGPGRGSVRGRRPARSRREVNFPYIPGLLSFREIPALLAAFAELRQPPDVVMLDGQGIATRAGSAWPATSACGSTGRASGCAKSWLVGEHGEPGPNAGDATPLTVDG